jgi:hypothetical protein
MYFGEWKDDMRHGQGKQISQNGSRYTGTFLNDKKHGQGEMEMTRGHNMSRLNPKVYEQLWNMGIL